MFSRAARRGCHRVATAAFGIGISSRAVSFERNDGSLRFGRLPAGRLDVCPTGGYVNVRSSEAEVVETARRLLDAANGREGDPRAVWTLMDDALRRSFASFRGFRRRFERIRLEHAWERWLLKTSPTLDAPWARPMIVEQCGTDVSGAVWEVDVFFPRQEGVSAGAAQLFFVPRPDGPKLWVVY